MSIPLVAEIPLYLHHFIIFRFISLISANIYNLIWFLAIVLWLVETFFAPTEFQDNYDTSTLITNMFLFFNCFVHASIFPINFAIIFKEIQLSYGSLIDSQNSSSGDYYISIASAVTSTRSDLWWVNPASFY